MEGKAEQDRGRMRKGNRLPKNDGMKKGDGER